jgi:hypothetical protein
MFALPQVKQLQRPLLHTLLNRPSISALLKSRSEPLDSPADMRRELLPESALLLLAIKSQGPDGRKVEKETREWLLGF